MYSKQTNCIIKRMVVVWWNRGVESEVEVVGGVNGGIGSGIFLWTEARIWGCDGMGMEIRSRRYKDDGWGRWV